MCVTCTGKISAERVGCGITRALHPLSRFLIADMSTPCKEKHGNNGIGTAHPHAYEPVKSTVFTDLPNKAAVMLETMQCKEHLYPEC